MKVRIVCYEVENSWILSKFAKELHNSLIKIGINSTIDAIPDLDADINHHIIYLDFKKKTTIDTVMVTHVDYLQKSKILINTQSDFEKAICMSSHTVNQLKTLGINNKKLAFVNPAHDNTVSIKKYVIGIFSNTYADARKNEEFLIKLSSQINKEYFSFVIMGSGWELIVEQVKNNGIEVKLLKFDKAVYNVLFKEIDFLMYMGNDEGSMSFLDALAAGVDTIVTKQGFHLDANNGITFGFENYNDLLNIFKQIESQKAKKINAVSCWTWDNYAIEHVAIWNELLLNNKNQRAIHPIKITRDFTNASADKKVSLKFRLLYYYKLIRTSLQVRSIINKKSK